MEKPILFIRKATNQDSSDICELIFNIWHNEYDFKVNVKNFLDLQDIESYYSDNNGIFLVVVENNTIIGTIACNKLDTNKLVLKRMFIEKNHRQMGVLLNLCWISYYLN